MQDQKTEGVFNFGQALEILRAGDNAMARAGWNGKGMFIYFVGSNLYKAVTEIAKKEFGDMVPYREYIAIKTADSTVVPWVASQTDLLATDWYQVK